MDKHTRLGVCLGKDLTTRIGDGGQKGLEEVSVFIRTSCKLARGGGGGWGGWLLPPSTKEIRFKQTPQRIQGREKIKLTGWALQESFLWEH